MTTYWYDPPPAPTVNGIPVCVECNRPLVGREERYCESCDYIKEKKEAEGQLQWTSIAIQSGWMAP